MLLAELASAQVPTLTIDRPRIDLSRHESAYFKLDAAKDGQGFLRIFGPDWRQAKEIELPAFIANQPLSISWNGTDDSGAQVPDEAYFVVLDVVDTLGKAHQSNPIAKPSEQVVVEDLVYDSLKKVIEFRLERAARVTLHAGIGNGGPLLKTFFSGKPLPKGEHVLAWDGWDDGQTLNIATSQNFKLFAHAESLWEPSVIITGSPQKTFSSYRRETPSRFSIPIPSATRVGGLQENLPKPHDYTPEPRFSLRVESDEIEKTLPVVRGDVELQVVLDESIRIPILERRFEIILFQDLEFVAEVEEGRSPALVSWDSRTVPDGPHVLTVNVATLPGQMSAASTRVWVDNDAAE